MEYTGFESAFVSTGDASYTEPAASPEVERKTSTKDTKESKGDKTAQQIVEQTGEKNVLFGYRSITYNFTLAGLDKDYLKDPNKLRESTLNFVIAQSGGKGTAGFKIPGEATEDEKTFATQNEYDEPRYRKARTTQQAANDKKIENIALVKKFNESSPGRFDLFIDQVEIETLMTFNKDTNLTLPTKIQFEVIEPYSINGFIEALHVAAVAAGFPSYISAPFVIKLEFWGIPDDDVLDFKEPVKIPDSERYFPFGFTGVDVEVTERGTRYKCSCVPYEQRYMGQPNKLKKPIKMAGSSVSEILTNFMDGLNEQNRTMYLTAYKNGKENEVDQYKVKFVEWDETNGWTEKTSGALPSKKLVDLHRDNALYGMINPAESGIKSAYKEQGKRQPTPEEKEKAPASIKYVPGKTVVHFQEGMNVTDVITAVVRDSEYIRDILKDVKKHTDSYGMVDYFQIRMETEVTEVQNPHLKRPAHIFTFVVSPYKIHYSKIPNLADNIINEKELKKLSRREYNYFYTGLNVDVLNFKIQFNTLYFEAIPAALGQKDQSDGKNAIGNNNTPKTQQSSTDNQTASQSQVPLNPKQVVETQIQSYSGTASQPLADPYSELARNLHNAVVNSAANMITGDIEIAGDPFYLVTGGMGNYNPKPVAPGKLKGGEAAFNQQALMITVNFRNPIDILPLEQGGTMYFDANRIPFSGTYMVTQCASTFKEGRFTQRLNIVRVPGQVLEYNVQATDISQSVTAQPDPKNQVVADASPALAPAERADSQSIATQLGRSLPNQGRPFEPSNFANNFGSLGGNANNLLPQQIGLVGRNGLPFTGVPAINQALGQDPLSNLRLNNNGLAGLTQSNLGTAAIVAAAANVITGNVPLKRAVGTIAGGILGAKLGSLINKSNPGSGIGEGASIKISPTAVLPSQATALDIKQGNTIGTALPTGSISNITSGLGSKEIDTVLGVGAAASNLVSGIGDKIRRTVSSSSDPAGIAAQAGLDSSKLSGLSTNLQSRLPKQIQSYVANTPADTNLVQSVNAGLALDYVPASKVKNLPATAPYATAPEPLAQSAPQPRSLVNNVQNLRQVNIVDKTVASDKLATAKSQLSSVANIAKVKDLNVSTSVSEKFGSNESRSPLTKLVNNLGNSESS